MIIVKLNIGTIDYFNPFSMSIVHIHIMNLNIFGIEEMYHIVISVSFRFIQIIVMIPKNFKSFYSDSMDSSLIYLGNQGFKCRPVSGVFKLITAVESLEGRIISDVNATEIMYEFGPLK